jgi:ABC transport system ATP-binding/permease protein
MARLLLSLKNTHLTFGGRPLLDGAELSLADDERLCLVGRNGSGKSTLLKIVAGLVEADDCEKFLQPGTTVHYLPQEPDFGAFETVQAYVDAGLGPMGDVWRAQHYLRELGLTGEEDPSRLSGGEMRRAALARALASDPDVLLLDEPTNHLDLPAIEWLEAELKTLRGALILISHDRRFMEALSNRTVWIDRGQTRRMDRGFVHFEEWRDKVLEEEEREQALLSQSIAREEHWMRYGVTARRKRNVRRVELLGTLRSQQREHIGKQGVVKLSVSDGNVSGKLVAEVTKLSKSFSERTIVSNLDLLVLRGNRLALVGPNGAGKTTLIKLITGQLAPDSGKVKLGTNLEVVTLDQNRGSLKPDDLLSDVITGGRGNSVTINGEVKHVISYMKDFLFRPEQARTPVSVLSGGERARLILARELARPSNVLILDEPTNDLDLETLDLLQEMLGDYPGTVIVVSHDRDFLDRVATSVLMHEDDGKWVEYAGGYSDMVAQRGLGVALRRAEKAALKTASPSEKPTLVQAKRKMTFKDKHALETLPAKMKALQDELKTLEAKMADTELFMKSPQVFETTSTRHAAAFMELSAAEEHWLELEILRQELENNP